MFEESLLSSAKHLDGVEMTPKSFVYTSSSSSSSVTSAAVPAPHGPVYDYGNRKASNAPKPTQPSSLTLPAPSNTAIESRLSAGNASLAPTQGPRGRFSFPLEAAISSPVASIASPNQKGNAVSLSVSTAVVSSSLSGIALDSFPSSFKISRSGSDSQLPHNSNQSHVKSASSHSPPSYMGGGASLLPLSISNPLDSLEMLGASLDLHQEEMEGNGQVDSHGYEEEEEGDEAQEEGAERESIGMSSKPFRVNHCYIPFIQISHITCQL